MNTTVNVVASNISFVYLALLPTLLILFFPRQDPVFRTYLVLTVVYWVLWALLARGVVWYGLAGFAGMSLLLGIILRRYEHDKALNAIALTTVSVSALFLLFMRLNLLSAPESLAYLSGQASAQQFIDTAYPRYRAVASIINETPVTSAQPAYVYRMGTYISFFVKNNDERVYTDDQLDMFTCLFQNAGYNVEAFLDTLKQQGFRYLVVSPVVGSIDITPDQTLKRKARTMASVLNRAIQNGLVSVRVNETGRNKIILLDLAPHEENN